MEIYNLILTHSTLKWIKIYWFCQFEGDKVKVSCTNQIISLQCLSYTIYHQFPILHSFLKTENECNFFSNLNHSMVEFFYFLIGKKSTRIAFRFMFCYFICNILMACFPTFISCLAL